MEEIRMELAKKVANCWDTYVDHLLTCTPSVLISRAEEIAAASFCHDQLVYNADAFPDCLLSHLLRYGDPLDMVKERWLEEQDADLGEAFESTLWDIYRYGPEPESCGVHDMSI